jgi:hypothetical protein
MLWPSLISVDNGSRISITPRATSTWARCRIGWTASGELGKLQRELTQARQAGVFDEGVGTDAEYQLTKAVQEAKKPVPDKGTVLGHLTNTKTLVEGVAAAGGLVTALTKAVELVQQFF